MTTQEIAENCLTTPKPTGKQTLVLSAAQILVEMPRPWRIEDKMHAVFLSAANCLPDVQGYVWRLTARGRSRLLNIVAIAAEQMLQ